MIIIRNGNLPTISRLLSGVGGDENKVGCEVRLSKPVKHIGLAFAFGLRLNAAVYVSDFVQPARAVSDNVVIYKSISRTWLKISIKMLEFSLMKLRQPLLAAPPLTDSMTGWMTKFRRQYFRRASLRLW